MTKFHFRLETLLQVRQSTRDQRRADLAEVEYADAELQSRLCCVEQKQTHVQHECRTASGPGVVDVRRLLQVQQYANALRDEAAGLVQRRQTLAAEIDCRHQALVEAEQELQVIEKLRDNQTQAHREEENRQEIKHLDEASLRIGFGTTFTLSSLGGGATAAPAA